MGTVGPTVGRIDRSCHSVAHHDVGGSRQADSPCAERAPPSPRPGAVRRRASPEHPAAPPVPRTSPASAMMASDTSRPPVGRVIIAAFLMIHLQRGSPHCPRLKVGAIQPHASFEYCYPSVSVELAILIDVERIQRAARGCGTVSQSGSGGGVGLPGRPRGAHHDLAGRADPGERGGSRSEASDGSGTERGRCSALQYGGLDRLACAVCIYHAYSYICGPH